MKGPLSFLAIVLLARLIGCHIGFKSTTVPVETRAVVMDTTAQSALISQRSIDEPTVVEVLAEYNEILFDTIYSGQKISKSLSFKNNSAVSITIGNVQTSCGCLTVEWKSTEILPLKQDTIELIFDSDGKMGFQNDEAIIHFDNGSTQTINLKGFVKPPLINFSVDTQSLELLKRRKEYQFEITNTGDSVIYIGDYWSSNGLDLDTVNVELSVSTRKLKKNEKAIVRAVIKNDISQDTSKPLDFVEVQLLLKDCCGLTETLTSLTIKKK